MYVYNKYTNLLCWILYTKTSIIAKTIEKWEVRFKITIIYV